jgi:hypothetical protein
VTIRAGCLLCMRVLSFNGVHGAYRSAAELSDGRVDSAQPRTALHVSASPSESTQRVAAYLVCLDPSVSLNVCEWSRPWMLKQGFVQ